MRNCAYPGCDGRARWFSRYCRWHRPGRTSGVEPGGRNGGGDDGDSGGVGTSWWPWTADGALDHSGTTADGGHAIDGGGHDGSFGGGGDFGGGDCGGGDGGGCGGGGDG
jgi:hypothetical protein